MSKADGEKTGVVSPAIRVPLVNGSERPSRSAAQNHPKKGGEGEEAEGEVRPLWRSAASRVSMPLRATSACAGGAHEAAGVIATLAGAAWALPQRAFSQTPPQTPKLVRVGILYGGSLSHPTYVSYRDAFLQDLRRRGWEGKKLIIEERAAEGRAERFAEHAAELVDLQVNVAVGSKLARPSRPSRRRHQRSRL